MIRRRTLLNNYRYLFNTVRFMFLFLKLVDSFFYILTKKKKTIINRTFYKYFFNISIFFNLNKLIYSWVYVYSKKAKIVYNLVSINNSIYLIQLPPFYKLFCYNFYYYKNYSNFLFIKSRKLFFLISSYIYKIKLEYHIITLLFNITLFIKLLRTLFQKLILLKVLY